MSDQALYRAILEVLEDNDGKCLDNTDERQGVASSIAQRLRLMTTHQVAEILGVSHNTLRRWRGEDKGPMYTEIEGRIRYSIVDVRNYIRMRK